MKTFTFLVNANDKHCFVHQYQLKRNHARRFLRSLILLGHCHDSIPEIHE